MISYWEQESFLHYDHILVGAGIVGLSTAIELKQHYPTQRVLVLERGLMTTGASSRNAGFACMGSVTELLDDLQHMSEQEVVALFMLRKRGLDILRTRLGDDNIGYAANGSYELISYHEAEAMDKIDYLNKLLMPDMGKLAFRQVNEKIKEFGFSDSYATALIENTFEGEINTGKMLRALTDLAISRGVEIKTGAEVSRFEEAKNHVDVIVKDTFRNETWTLKSRTITICTNAFTKALLPDADLTPGRGQILITHPIADLKLKGIYHFDKGYYYFRELNGRILIGGGRNLDFKTETTTELTLNKLIQIDLEQKLADIVIPHTHFEVAQRWAGIMAFGPTKQPVVKAFSDRVYGCFRMGGMGVAMGSEVARQVGAMVRKRM